MTSVRVDRTRRLPLIGALLVFVALAIWAVRHAFSTMDFVHGKGTQLGVIFTIAFAMLAFQTVLYYLEPAHRITDRQERQLNGLYVTVPVPLYNEDPQLLLSGLLSLLDQERPPNMVYVVDDGSAVVDPATGQKVPVDYSAARLFGKAVKMTELKQFLFFEGVITPGDPQALVKINGEPSMREDVVRLAGVTRAADLRFRPQFLEWDAVLTITFIENCISLESVLSLVDAAGRTVGVGEWRPERKGESGTFIIDENKEFKVIG